LVEFILSFFSSKKQSLQKVYSQIRTKDIQLKFVKELFFDCPHCGIIKAYLYFYCLEFKIDLKNI